jgi:hypothetical protein
MTVQGAGGLDVVFSLSAILVDGPQRALYSQLITYLAIISIGVWGLVVISTILRIRTRRQYRSRMQRKVPV